MTTVETVHLAETQPATTPFTMPTDKSTFDVHANANSKCVRVRALKHSKSEQLEEKYLKFQN